MTTTTDRLEALLQQGVDYISKTKEADLKYKKTPDKWSKQEILGHLIDSGINNLQRFTEVQFESKPYKIKTYNQNELVKTNNYQEAKIQELVNFWLALNHRIISLVNNLNTEALSFKTVLPNHTEADLKFLITDYVEHMEHHLKQIATN